MAAFTDILKEKLEVLVGERGDKTRRAVRYNELDKLLSGKLIDVKASVPTKAQIEEAAEQAVDARAWDKFNDWFNSLTAGKYGSQIKAEFDRYVEEAKQLFRTNAETATFAAQLFAASSSAAEASTQLIKEATELLKGEVETLASAAEGSAQASANHAAASSASANEAGEEALAAQQSKVAATTSAASAEASRLQAAEARDGAEGFAAAAEQSHLNAQTQASSASAYATLAVDAKNDASAFATTSLTARSDALGYATVAQQIAADVTEASGTIQAKYSVKVDVNGYVTGFGFIASANDAAPQSAFTVLASNFLVAQPIAGGGAKQVFEVGSVDGIPTMILRGNFFGDGVIGARHITAESIAAVHLKARIVSADYISINGVVTDNISPNAVTGFVAEQRADRVVQASQLLLPSIVRRSGTRVIIQLAIRFGLHITTPSILQDFLLGPQQNGFSRTLVIRRWGDGGYIDVLRKNIKVATSYTIAPSEQNNSTIIAYGDNDFIYQYLDTTAVSDGVVYSYEILMLTEGGAYDGYPGGIFERSIVITEFKR